MPIFCEQCGTKLPSTGKFCGSCGTPIPVVIEHCPTCGQEWDGVKVAAAPVATTAAPKKKTAPKTAPAVEVVATPTVVVQSGNQPIYGPLYVAGRDCPNCGAANMGKKTCSLCESEN